ncbi:hypothetical protein [Geobacillus thermodenitrificans]|uniref:hypothetical protein n=1 Tax=Geobacillus thermodenitrificans TaxID=33940 RepID=UPI002E1E4ED2|nr:hypothetical protein [Geobacillus thermodenitrificans]
MRNDVFSARMNKVAQFSSDCIDVLDIILARKHVSKSRSEADEYRRNKGRAGGVNVTISSNTFNVRQESDIKRIAYELAKLIEKEGAFMT